MLIFLFPFPLEVFLSALQLAFEIEGCVNVCLKGTLLNQKSCCCFTGDLKP